MRDLNYRLYILHTTKIVHVKIRFISYEKKHVLRIIAFENAIERLTFTGSEVSVCKDSNLHCRQFGY